MVQCFPSKSGKKARMPIHTTSIQHGIEVLGSTIRQELELKGEEVKLPFFVNDITMYVGNKNKKNTKMPLE